MKSKLVIFITLLIVLFIIFIFFVFRPYDYEKKYTISKFNVKELYDKNDKKYIFVLKYHNNSYPFIIRTDYIRNKELIKDIQVYKKGQEICILPISNYMDFYPLCSKKKNIYSYNLTKKNDFYTYNKIKKEDKKYKDIIINKLDDTNFLLYNYKGFYIINNDRLKDIKIFEKDVYNIDIIYQLDNYIIVADYNQKYYFNKFYIINMIDGKVKEIDSKIDISFNSIFIGNIKKNIFILDKKEKKEYKINLRNKKIEEINYSYIENNKLKTSSYKDVIKNSNLKENKNFKLIDNTLYSVVENIKIKVSNKHVDKIIKEENEKVYYLCDGSLYLYDNFLGEVLLLTNFEWNFKNINMIYIYK